MLYIAPSRIQVQEHHPSWKRGWIITPTLENGLSHLPLKKAYSKEVADPVEIFQLSQLEVLPVNAGMIPQATQRDPVLSRVVEHIKQGWPPVSKKKLEPFYRGKDELTLQDGCFMWGSRVIISPKYWAQCVRTTP